MKALYLMLAGMMSMTGCEGSSVPAIGTDLSALKAMTPEQIRKLSSLKIFFGHQSVGINILDGMSDIMKEAPGIQLSIVQSPEASAWNTPILGHAKIGKNTQPASKCDSFRAMLDGGVGLNADIAFMKFCYVDIDENTDVPGLFKKYSETASAISAAYPRLQLIHVTAPVTRYPNGLRQKISRAVGRVLPEDKRNANRNAFNAKLTAQYAAQGNLFDLAAFEAGALPGTRGCGYEYNGSWCHTLCPGFTDDGGHLNAIGRKYVAEKLLLFLVKGE